MTKKRYKSQTTNRRSRKNAASALILAVILTSLLAIIGVMFVMIARVDKMATSAISENKELNFAVETVVAKISQELVLDVPGMPKGKKDYYDYPDANNAWLASLEPYKNGANYKWRQISDVYEKLPDLELTAGIIPDYQEPSYVGDSNSTKDYPADADGDGVADSKWVKLDDITSNKGKPIYAAIRIVDNGGMLNVNTAYKFDPNATGVTAADIDGSSQLQINLAALSQRGANGTLDTAAKKLQAWRCGTEPNDLSLYERNVVWRYNEPNGAYTPFDIGDELELRNRFLINLPGIDSPIENVWTDAFKNPNLRVPVAPGGDLQNWFYRSQHDVPGPNDIYSYRHIATTCNMDRIIDPNGIKMVNVNRLNDINDVNSLYTALLKGLDPCLVDAGKVAAQIAVNLKDYRDSDSDVTFFPGPNVTTYYGFEVQPFISEIAAIIDKTEANKPNKNFYALELYNPFNISVSLSDFVLSISNGSSISLSGTIDPNGYFVISNNSSKFTIDSRAARQPDDTRLEFSGNYVDNPPPDGTFDSWDNYIVTLKRTVGGSDIIILDFQDTNNGWFKPAAPTVFYAQRDTRNWHIVYQKMNTTLAGSLGSSNTVSIPGKNYNLSLANKKFVTVGDIARVLTVGPSSDPNDMIGVKLAAAEPNEESVRLNLQNAAFQQIFNYLTVFDPYNFYPGDANETRVKGRININTAPWYVLAQLPWVSQRKSGYNNTDLAQAIAAYRDKLATPVNYSGRSGELGFRSIGELNRIVAGSNDYRIDYYARDTNDLDTFPDLTASDGAKNDFEERDVIFSRISNLATVRSDVFTAYILVRIGTDGPQKRVMAILDRSNVYSGDGKVRIVALHPVPDPR